MELTGKIIAVLPERGGVSKAGNEWKIQEYVLETMEQCKEHNITPLRFFIELENDDDYVVNRIREQMM